MIDFRYYEWNASNVTRHCSWHNPYHFRHVPQTSRSYWDENGMFIKQLGEKAGFDLNKLMEQRQYAQEQSKRERARYQDIEDNIKLRRSFAEKDGIRSSVKPVTRHTDQKINSNIESNLQNLRNKNSWLIEKGKQESSSQKDYVADQMRRLRDK